MTAVAQVTSASAGELACLSTAGRWRRSSSWAEYSGRCDGKATYVRGDIRRGLITRLNSKKGKKIQTDAISKSIEHSSTATTLASTAPSSGLTGTCTTVRLSDLSSGVRFSDLTSDVHPELSASAQLTDGDVKITSEPLSVEFVVVGKQKIQDKVEKVEAAESMEETALVLSDEELRRKQGVKILFASTAAHNFALQLTNPASQSIWLNYFNGDFAAQAANTSNLMSAALVAGVFVNPVIAGTSDVVGRKPVVMGGLALSAFGKALCAVQPGASALRVQSTLMTSLAMAHPLGVQTALGDLFVGDGKGFGAAQAQMLLATTIPGLVSH